MESLAHSVERYYGHAGILESVMAALREQGVDLKRVRPDDLAPMDEFHVRGREGTVELASRITWNRSMRVLDVGSGVGGSSRFLATTFGCTVTGIDLTREFVHAAIGLSELIGLNGNVKFVHGSALELPFEDGAFDVVWTQHTQMNIEDKRRFYAEMTRVLKPGGQLLFHDIFRNGESRPYYPMPWAEDPAISFLTTPEKARVLVEDAGLTVTQWEDTTERSLAWMNQMAEKAKQAGRMPFSVQVIMGPGIRQRLDNFRRSLTDSHLRVIQAVAVR
jgi:ubiquinone/menaquinone biosynthesis C-methylase UbiE